ncbi:hypothetical protein ACF0H5_024214 [Mactra antiquata]
MVVVRRLNLHVKKSLLKATERNRAQSRPRLLIIRPPEGSGKRHGIVVFANSRPKPSNTSPPLSVAISALQETSAAAQAGLDRAFGGHPQSMALQQSRTSPSTSTNQVDNPASKPPTTDTKTTDSASSSSTSTGGKSIRMLLRGLRQRAHGTVDNNSRPNIFRLSDGIPPRAAPPVLPLAQKFGALNIPQALEAELRRIQEQAKRASNVRQPNIRPSHSHHDHSIASTAIPPSPFHGGVIDLSKVSLHDRGQMIDTPSSDSGRTSGSNPRWDIGTLRSTGMLGRNGISLRSGSSKSRLNSNTGSDTAFIKNNDLLQMPKDRSTSGKTGSNLRTFKDKNTDNNNSGVDKAAQGPTLDLKSLLMKSIDPSAGSFDLSNSVGSNSGLNPQLPGQTKSAQTSSNTGKTAGTLIQNKNSIPAPSSKQSQTPVASVNLNTTATASSASAEANSTTNTTSTKSVKTKTIKVTTVVKNGSKADVAAAKASQAGIANAVAQGKDIQSADIANLAKIGTSAAKAAVSPKKTGPPVGSITVKREPNGESIITLSDGQGEPVILRAVGPVKIERVVKPNGRIQFLINPINQAPVTKPTTAVVDLGEIEPEDITTTTMATVSSADASWITSTPFYVDQMNTELPMAASFEPLTSAVSKTISNPGGSQVETTVQVNTSSTSNSSTQNSTSVSKSSSVSAKAETQGVMQLFPSQKIPPPPKFSSMNFGNKDVINPFFLDTNRFLPNSGFNIEPSSNTVSSQSLQANKNVVKQPVQLFPGVLPSDTISSSKVHSDVMPQYQLLGASPSLQFVPQSNTIP